MSRDNYRYTVYDNKSGFPICVDGTSKECAEKMGIKLSSWYNCVNRCGNGSNKRWTILKHDLVDRFCLVSYPKKENSPSMIRVTQLAKELSTTSNCIVNICNRIGCRIITAGPQKVRMVSSKLFFDALKGGSE